MVVQVQKVGNEFLFRLPPQAVEELDLMDGGAVEMRRAEPQAAPAFRYATADEVMRAFEESLPQHEAAYRELAK